MITLIFIFGRLEFHGDLEDSEKNPKLRLESFSPCDAMDKVKKQKIQNTIIITDGIMEYL